jgi:hypothetical protein
MRWLIAGGAAVFVAVLSCASAACAANYSGMAPLDKYLMDRSPEIALAKALRRRPSPTRPRSWY